MVNGLVTNVFTKAWQGKTFYSLKLNDGVVYGFGTYKPSAKEGDKVEFESKQNAKGYYEGIKETFKVTPGVEGVATGTPAPRKSADEKDFWGKKEVREVKNDHLRSLGASRNTAIEWIKTLIQAEAVKLPTKQADKEEALNLLFEGYVEKFMQEIEGKPVVKSAVKAPEPAVDAGEDRPAWE